MKLDRNTNKDKSGKYALVLLRQTRRLKGARAKQAQEAIQTLKELGCLRIGNENFGSQFFVLGYQDKFTPAALSAYAGAALTEAVTSVGKVKKELLEFAAEMADQSATAESTAHKIPS